MAVVDITCFETESLSLFGSKAFAKQFVTHVVIDASNRLYIFCHQSDKSIDMSDGDSSGWELTESDPGVFTYV